jgi:hypothetical protein
MAAGSLLTVIANQTSTTMVELLNNPNISFFKSVFKRHTNFATEPIEIPLTGSLDLHFNESVELKCVIPRHADLLSHLYLLVDIPDIFSGYRPPQDSDTTTTTTRDDGTSPATSTTPNALSAYRFKWIRELGSRMIESVQFTVGGTCVQQLDGEWIALWWKMFSSTDTNSRLVDRLTGNVPELHDPANTAHAMGVYPTATLHPDDNQDPELTTTNGASSITNPYYRTASIPGRTLIVPIPFWFSMKSSDALPLVALQNHEMEVRVTLRRLRDLYTVTDTRPDADTYGCDGPPLSAADAMHAIGHFQAGVDYGQMREGSDLRLPAGLRQKEDLTVTPRLLGTYVFLSDEEQSMFATNSHEYLVEQVSHRSTEGVYGTFQYDLTLNNVTKSLVWYAQREDVQDRNDWSNYSNHTTPGGTLPGTSLAAYQPLVSETLKRESASGATRSVLGHFINSVPDASAARMPVTKFQGARVPRQIISKSTILLNGIELFGTQSAPYFELLQPLQCHLKESVPGVFSYSFALQPRAMDQPSGACDTSRAKKVQLQIQTVDSNADSDVSYSLHVYIVTYNVFRIMGGMGGLKYMG